MKNLLLLLSICSIVISSCKKEDSNAPEVEFILPLSTSQYYVPDVVPVHIIVRDNEYIQRVAIDILDENGIVRGGPIIISSGEGNQWEIQRSITLDNIHTPTGIHYVRVTAEDSKNKRITFRDIYVYELPLAVENIYLLSTPSLNQIQIDTLYNNEWVFAKSISSDYGLSLSGSYFSELLIGGDVLNGLTILNGGSLEQTNYFPVLNPNQSSYFLDLKFDSSSLTYLSGSNDGFITTRTKNGNQISSFQVPGQFIPHIVSRQNNNIICYQKQTSNSTKQIAIYNAGSGIIQNTLLIDFEPIEIFNDQGNEVLIFGNSGGNSRVYKFNTGNNTIAPLPEFEFNEPMVDVVAISNAAFENQFYSICFESKIATIDLVNGTQVLGATISGKQIQYNKVEDVLYVLENNALHIMPWGNPFSSEEINVNSESQSILIQYNK